MGLPFNGRTRFQNSCLILVALFFYPAIIGAQNDLSYSFIAAGHAYGAHSGTNIGLHPALLNKFNEGIDSNVEFIVFTGDIVNQSTLESWQQVELEMSNYSLPYYYVMGNHGDNEIGYQVFEEKFGGSYYTYEFKDDRFIVLNSTVGNRSINSEQLSFLEESILLSIENSKNIFIFFHEILWNSDEKYIGVRSNSRSRFDQMVNYSNYWEDVHPILSSYEDKVFYLITGDVGGNPDAISAFYDKRDNVHFISSGMGELENENYLQLNIFTDDSVAFELVPLRDGISLLALEYYSVPNAPDSIRGPFYIEPGVSGIEYAVDEIFNAESYAWEVPEKVYGISETNTIDLDFDESFISGKISVKALRDGYGESDESSIFVESILNDVELIPLKILLDEMFISQDYDFLSIKIDAVETIEATIRFFDIKGRILAFEKIELFEGSNEIKIDKDNLPKGIMLMQISSSPQIFRDKILIW